MKIQDENLDARSEKRHHAEWRNPNSPRNENCDSVQKMTRKIHLRVINPKQKVRIVDCVGSFFPGGKISDSADEGNVNTQDSKPDETQDPWKFM